jgi:hypothetical protein
MSIDPKTEGVRVRPGEAPPPSTGRAARRSGAGPAVMLGFVLVAFAASRLWIAGVASEREYDEGVYLCSARAVAAGEELFTDVFSSQPPAIVETLAVALVTFGDRLFVARTFILAFALLALFAVADIARRLAGPWAAPAAAAALAVSMTFLDLAHVVVAETPAMGLALAAITVCLASRDRGWNTALLAAAGALFGLAALFKLIVVPLAAPFGFLLLLESADPGVAASERARWRFDRRIARVVARCVIVAAAAAAVFTAPMLVYDARVYFDQVVGFHLSKYEAYELDGAVNLQRAAGHLRADAAVVAAATAGLIVLAVRGRALAATWLLLWTTSMLFVLSVQTPLFWRHFVLLTPPVAIAAGAAVALLWPRRAGVLAVAAAVLWTSVALVHDRGMFPLLSDGGRNRRSDEALAKAARWIDLNTPKKAFVGSDDQMAVYVSGRRSPPGLCDTSWARVASGSLQLEEAARASLEASVIMIRQGSRLTRLPGYLDWLETNYEKRSPEVTGLGTRQTIWIRRKNATAEVTSPRSVRHPNTNGGGEAARSGAAVSDQAAAPPSVGPSGTSRGANRIKPR